jgi:prevent-host-death family protein
MAMSMANIADLKARLSELVERASQGERILICRHNRPVAELGPVAGVRTDPRPTGPLPNRPTFDVPPSFFEPMSEEELGAWHDSPLASATVYERPASRPPSRAAEPKPSYGARTRRPKRRP